MHPTLTPGIDVALLAFWGFVLFFVGLVFYLRREDRREGYPVEDDVTGRIFPPGGPLSMARPKIFHLPFDQGDVANPTGGRDPLDLPVRRAGFYGSPLIPTGDPLVDGIGPASWAERVRRPDLDMHGLPRIVPMRDAAEFFLSLRDPDMRGMPVLGADKRLAGHVTDLWIDQADRLIRYIEIELADTAGEHVLAPMAMAKLDRRRRRVVVDALLAEQFAGAPRLAGKGEITRYEEERVIGYFGGGYLYATPSRQEPWL